MTLKTRKLGLAFASATLLTLAACGGGGSDATVSTPAAGTTSVPVTVVDDAIGNATVCLDTNLNGVCDSGEPSGKTDTKGQVTLQVPTGDVGKYPILAIIGSDAVDARYGAVTVPFTMTAPADKTAVVSPLTTLVQTLIASTGASSAQAEASVKAQTGLNVSLFEDFTKSTTADSQTAGTVARMVVVTTQQQSSTLGSAVGSTAIDGAKITQADLNKIIQNKLLEILPALLTALADPAVQAATTPAAKEAALLALVDTGLTTNSVATLVAINNQTSPSATVVAADTPAAGATLNNLKFQDAANWFSRVLSGSLAQNTPDATGKVRYVERRNSSVSSVVASWGAGSSPNRQSDLHFNGSAWVNCALNHENTSTVRDAQGNNAYNYCDNAETGKSNRAKFDISGKTMANVLTDVRVAGYTNLSIGDNTAATLTSALASTTFPLGSSLFYQSVTPLTEAISYYPGSGNLVTQYSPAVSAGGIASTQAAGVGCNSAEFTGNAANSSTLESMISAMTGTPCVFTTGSFVYGGVTYTSPDQPSEAWGNSTTGIGTIGTAPIGTGTAPGFYSGNTKLRMAFKGTGTNPVTYYACKERFNNGSNRNCTPIGTGSYTIATLGDARVMTLNNLPAQASPLTYTRVFVERGGRIYFGYQNKPNASNSARLNLKATNALFARLGLPVVDVATPLALTKTSYAGDWEVFDNATPLQSTVVSLKANGTAICTDTDGTLTPAVVTSKACTVTFSSLVNGDFSVSTTPPGNSTVTGNANFLTGAISGNYTDNNVIPPATGTFSGTRR